MGNIGLITYGRKIKRLGKKLDLILYSKILKHILKLEGNNNEYKSIQDY